MIPCIKLDIKFDWSEHGPLLVVMDGEWRTQVLTVRRRRCHPGNFPSCNQVVA